MALETHTLQREVCTPTTAAQTAAPYGTTPSAHTHMHKFTGAHITRLRRLQLPKHPREGPQRAGCLGCLSLFPSLFPFPVPFHLCVYLVGGRAKADHVGDELHATEGEDEEDTGDDHARQGDDGGDAGQVGDLLDMGCGEKLDS